MAGGLNAPRAAFGVTPHWGAMPVAWQSQFHGILTKTPAPLTLWRQPVLAASYKFSKIARPFVFRTVSPYHTEEIS